MTGSPSLKLNNNSLLNTLHQNDSTHSFVDGGIDWLPILGVVNNTAVNVGAQIVPRALISFPLDAYLDGATGPHGSSNPSLLRSRHTGFCNVRTSLPSCHKGSLLFTSHQHFFFFVFLVIAIPTCMMWYLTVVSVCTSLLIIDVEHHPVYSLAICMSSFEKYQFRSFAHLKNRVICLLAVELFEYLIYSKYLLLTKCMVCRILSYILYSIFFKVIWRYRHINSSNPWTWNIFLIICVIFSFFFQCFMVFTVQFVHLLG